MTISRATQYMPDDAVYVAVVDPRVGSERRSIAVRTAAAPCSWGRTTACSRSRGRPSGRQAAAAIEDERVMLSPVSRRSTVATCSPPPLAVGFPLDEVGTAIDVEELRIVEMPGAMVTPGAVGTRVIEVDAFGSVQLSARPTDLEAAGIGPPFTVSGRHARWWASSPTCLRASSPRSSTRRDTWPSS